MLKVDLGLRDGEELNLVKCYDILKKDGINPNFGLLTQTRTLRFRFNGYYFNVFHTGKIIIYITEILNDEKFQLVLKELEDNIFKKNIVSTSVSE